MGMYDPANVYASDGLLNLRTKYENGQWSSAGVSGHPGFTASQGKWEVRARFDRAVGIGYVFLLYPADGSWPPEIDIAEGRVNGPEVMGVYHWDADNKQEPHFTQVPDMTQWHTYGVEIEGNSIRYTIDGDVWGTVTNSSITTKQLWLGFQTGAMDPNGSANEYETIPGGVPNSQTPASSVVQIDWAAHYRR